MRLLLRIGSGQSMNAVYSIDRTYKSLGLMWRKYLFLWNDSDYEGQPSYARAYPNDVHLVHVPCRVYT